MKKILLLIICVLLRLQISAQVAVTGHVVDDENKPLASVIIKRFSAQHKMRGYATSNHDGEFLINAEVGDSLTFSMLGFQEAHIAVKSKMQPLTVKMSSGAIELKEVSVKSDKVHERGDTVSYLVGAFANSNDRSIGDVIAKMPGFDVDKSSGKISYEGKPISKFYIEGLDMLLDQFADRTGNADIMSFAEVFAFAKRSGGNFASIIEETSEHMRARHDTEREIQVLIASRKLEQRVMNLIPIFILAYLKLTSGEFLSPLYGNAFGVCFMTGCLALYGVTILLADRILDIQM